MSAAPDLDNLLSAATASSAACGILAKCLPKLPPDLANIFRMALLGLVLIAACLLTVWAKQTHCSGHTRAELRQGRARLRQSWAGQKLQGRQVLKIYGPLITACCDFWLCSFRSFRFLFCICNFFTGLARISRTLLHSWIVFDLIRKASRW